MTITNSDAAKALSDVASVTRRVRASLLYQRLSSTLVVWGALSFVGYISEHRFPALAQWVWRGVYLTGLVATVLLAAFGGEKRGVRGIDWRQIASLLIFISCGIIISRVVIHLQPRELGAFWPIFFMTGYMILGVWIGHTLIAIGFIIISLTISAYFLAGTNFVLIMAFINGLGLMLAGAWLRRI